MWREAFVSQRISHCDVPLVMKKKKKASLSRHRYERLKQLSQNWKKVNLSHHIGWRHTAHLSSCFSVLSILIKLGHAGLICSRNCQCKGHYVFVEHIEGTQHNSNLILAPHVNMLIFTTNITHCYTLALPHVITFTWHFNCHLFNSVLPNNPCCSVLIESPTHMLSISSYLMCFFFLPPLSSFEGERQRNFNLRCVSCFSYQRSFYILLCEILHFRCVKSFYYQRGALAISIRDGKGGVHTQ